MPSVPHILAISYYFPPLTTPRSIRLLILARYMEMNNLANWTILCVNPATSTENSDITLNRYIPSSLKLIRTNSLELNVIKKIGARSKLFSIFLTPDPFTGWIPSARRAAEKLLFEHKYDLIYSFSSPITSHLIARHLHWKFKLPWIAFLSDPITNSPIYDNLALKEKILAFYEKSIFTEADFLLFTNDYGRKWATKDYSNAIKDKSFLLPHAYDRTFYEGSFEKISFFNDSKFKILHAGALYGKRTPDILLKALNIIRENFTDCYSDLCLILLGANNRSLAQTIHVNDLDNVIQLLPIVPYIDSLAYMENSDLLLVFDAENDYSPYLPSKLIDYFGAKKPILGITPRIGPTYELLDSYGQKVVTTYKETDIAQAIVSLWEDWKGKRLGNLKNLSRNYSEFSIEKIAQDQLKIFNKVISR